MLEVEILHVLVAAAILCSVKSSCYPKNLHRVVRSQCSTVVCIPSAALALHIAERGVAHGGGGGQITRSGLEVDRMHLSVCRKP